MKVVTIVGARPQFVKAAVLSRCIRSHSNIQESIIHTGQHFDTKMSDIFFKEMQIPTPQYNLDISGGSHGKMTGQMLIAIEEVLIKEKPDSVLVYGDTNSTFAGAMAAAKLNIPIAHVEAGLRSFNRKMPEEINRILTDQLSTWLFCPSQVSQSHLLNEGIDEKKIHIVGDIMLDAVRYYSQLKRESNAIKNLISSHNEYYLATIHRAENTDSPDRLINIIDALKEIALKTTVILPLHPRTKKYIDMYKLDLGPIQTVDPLGYFDILALTKNSKAVLTDSGGLQKEAFFLRRPCVTLRDETEWVETVEVGANQIVGAHKAKILDAIAHSKVPDSIFDQPIYGNADCADKIIKTLL